VEDAVEEELIPANPVPKLARRGRRVRFYGRTPTRSPSRRCSGFLKPSPRSTATSTSSGSARAGVRTRSSLFRSIGSTTGVRRWRYGWTFPTMGRCRSDPEDGTREVDCSYDPGDLRSLRAATARLPGDRPAGVRLHRRPGAAALARVAQQAHLAADATPVRSSNAGTVQHPRHLHHPRPLGRRRPRLGRPGLRHLGADDLPPLPAVDAQPGADGRSPGRDHLRPTFGPSGAPIWAPAWAPTAGCAS